MIKKMALILVAASFLLVFVVPVPAQNPTFGTFQPQDHVGTA